jgi:hypothetical protein
MVDTNQRRAAWWLVVSLFVISLAVCGIFWIRHQQARPNRFATLPPQQHPLQPAPESTNAKKSSDASASGAAKASGDARKPGGVVKSNAGGARSDEDVWATVRELINGMPPVLLDHVTGIDFEHVMAYDEYDFKDLYCKKVDDYGPIGTGDGYGAYVGLRRWRNNELAKQFSPAQRSQLNEIRLNLWVINYLASELSECQMGGNAFADIAEGNCGLIEGDIETCIVAMKADSRIQHTGTRKANSSVMMAEVETAVAQLPKPGAPVSYPCYPEQYAEAYTNLHKALPSFTTMVEQLPATVAKTCCQQAAGLLTEVEIHKTPW